MEKCSARSAVPWKQLSYDESVEELARMLGGAKITQAVLEIAAEMKDLAQQQKNTRLK